MNNILQETINTLASIKQQVEAQLAQASALRAAAFEPLLQWVASTGQVSVITLRGYTPSFNDGDPCEHSSDCYINIKQHLENEIEIPDFGEDYSRIVDAYFDSVYVAPLCKQLGLCYKSPDQAIVEAILEVIYPAIEEQYGTNYCVQFILKDGKFERTDREYYVDY